MNSEINNWLSQNFETAIPQDIVVLNFNISQVDPVIELNYFGYTNFDEIKVDWLKKVSFSPRCNHLLIENKNKQYSNEEIYTLTKMGIIGFIKNGKFPYPKNIRFTTFTYLDGIPEVIYRQRSISSLFLNVGSTLAISIIIVTIFTLVISGIFMAILIYTWD